MFQRLTSRNGRNKESRVKRVLQAALLLAVVIWLLYHAIMREDIGSEEIKLNIEDVDVDIGRKGKAGSENVIILDGSKGKFEMYETSEAEDNDGDASHIPKKDEDSQDKRHEDFQELAIDDGKSETQEEQVSNKDNDPVVNEVGPVEVKSSGLDDDHDGILKLPSERNSENFSDQNEDESRKDEQNELITVNEIMNATEEAITSDQETVLSSNNQLDGGEESKVEKVAIDSHGATEHDNLNVGEKVSTDSQVATERETVNGGEVSMEASTNNANSDEQHTLLPNEETTEISNNNEGSGNANFNSENDFATDLETSDHHVAETVNSDLKIEEEIVKQPDSTDDEVLEREAIESTSLSDSNDDNPSVEEDANTKSDEGSMKTSLADIKLENTELFGNTDNTEEESVESHGDDASSAETPTSNDVDTERMVTDTNTDSTESHSDGSSGTQNAGDNASTETSEETKNTEDGSKPNEETPNTESTESQRENYSEGDNNSNIVSEDLKTEENLNTEISAE